MIKRKSSIYKIIHENNGQLSFFGRDNLSFKSVNMVKKQHLDNICRKFKLKKIIKNNKLYLDILNINFKI